MHFYIFNFHFSTPHSSQFFQVLPLFFIHIVRFHHFSLEHQNFLSPKAEFLPNPMLFR
eukprot:TRINITY_DN7822_c0_g1_i1.p1 TRINITY_DN7822_c0_g1~~TRINITY_DN7822_c0_g1_i1.p1  ORF type:complete len:58 (-),score=2.99 TRINITY_DN7822_c0_g1_i1:487-660(-)